ncbi:MAG TPA: phosphatase PAP2-related protein [Holophaga sp.]|nr:phosphatase PAP2-related protein [Holophaga sp.]
MDRNEHTSSPIWLIILAVLAFRYLCHGLALLMILPHEMQPGIVLPDLLLRHIPYVDWIARWNYVLWILCYIPSALWIAKQDCQLFIRLVLTDAALSLIRGLTIPLTGIGPVMGPDINALHPFALWPAWLSLVNPIRAIWGNTASVYLTKDLFFSGHIATTFLLYLFSRRFGKVSRVFLWLNLFTLGVVFLAHLHYSIDVIAAYAITYGVYRVSERCTFSFAWYRNLAWEMKTEPKVDFPSVNLET